MGHASYVNSLLDSDPFVLLLQCQQIHNQFYHNIFFCRG